MDVRIIYKQSNLPNSSHIHLVQNMKDTQLFNEKVKLVVIMHSQ